MDDTAFEEIRDALAPARPREARMGGLFILEASLDGDDRIHSLLATLLRDRDHLVAAAAASLCYASDNLRGQLSRELRRAWATGAPEYRVALVQSLSSEALGEIADYVVEGADVALKLAFLARLAEVQGDDSTPAADRQLELALFLSRDASADVRAQALHALADHADTPGARVAAERLLSDQSPPVRAAAARTWAQSAADPAAAMERLRGIMNDPDLDVRGALADAIRTLQERANRGASDDLVAEQMRLIDAGEFRRAMGVASQVFMRDAEHAEAKYQMARAAAGLGDARRALRLLVNALEHDLAQPQRALDDPLFATAQAAEVWEEIDAVIRGEATL